MVIVKDKLWVFRYVVYLSDRYMLDIWLLLSVGEIKVNKVCFMFSKYFSGLENYIRMKYYLIMLYLGRENWLGFLFLCVYKIGWNYLDIYIKMNIKMGRKESIEFRWFMI